jgi:hypothetical protein
MAISSISGLMSDGNAKSPYAALRFIPRHCDVPVRATCGRPKPGQAQRPAPTMIDSRLASGTFFIAASCSISLMVTKAVISVLSGTMKTRDDEG